MTTGEQVRWWLLLLAGVILFFWIFGSTLTPFLAGAAIAYFLDPLADRLERAGLSRFWATATISLIGLLTLATALLVVVPLLAHQLAGLIDAAPGLFADFRMFVARYVSSLPESVTAEGGPVATVLAQLRDNAQAWGVALLRNVASSGLILFNFLALLVITPIVAFYLLFDWDRMVGEIDHWLPRRHAPTLRRLAGEVDAVLAGFLRGQLTVCLILGVFYAAALGAIGLNFGVLIGSFAGLISFIPFVGAWLGGALSLAVALAQFWGDWASIAMVLGVFLFGQFIEGNFLSPKLVGDSVGLHPVWLMLALSLFGSAMGFTGMLIAVPAAATIGVLLKFALELYREGRLYLGGEPVLPIDPDWKEGERGSPEEREP